MAAVAIAQRYPSDTHVMARKQPAMITYTALSVARNFHSPHTKLQSQSRACGAVLSMGHTWQCDDVHRSNSLQAIIDGP